MPPTPRVFPRAATVLDDKNTDDNYENISIVDQNIKAVLNAMENAASLELYDILVTIAISTELPIEIRTAAITALKGLIPWRYYAVRGNQLCV